MDSGRAVSLFPDTLRIFRLTSNPMESGRDSKTLDETSSSTSFCSPAIESGIACFNGTKTSKTISYNKQLNYNLFQMLNNELLHFKVTSFFLFWFKSLHVNGFKHLLVDLNQTLNYSFVYTTRSFDSHSRLKRLNQTAALIL